VLLLGALVYGFVRYSAYTEDRDLLKLSFVSPDGTESPIYRLEIANTEAERSKGLMYRKPGDLAADRGMIFIFPEQKVRSFWMVNTYISLDMVFIANSGEVVGVLHDVPILNKKPRSIPKPAMYLVELLAGTAKSSGIEAGAKMKYVGVLPRGN